MPTSDYTPDVALVARKDLSRTKDNFGAEVGTFSAVTRPTDTQVTALVADVIPEVADVIGDDIPVAFFDDAKNVVALRAAMQIELDFYADQVNTGRSIYPQLKEQFEAALARLSAAIVRAEEGDGTNTDGSGAGTRPRYSFPDSPSIVGLDTVM